MQSAVNHLSSASQNLSSQARDRIIEENGIEAEDKVSQVNIGELEGIRRHIADRSASVQKHLKIKSKQSVKLRDLAVGSEIATKSAKKKLEAAYNAVVLAKNAYVNAVRAIVAVNSVNVSGAMNVEKEAKKATTNSLESVTNLKQVEAIAAKETPEGQYFREAGEPGKILNFVILI